MGFEPPSRNREPFGDTPEGVHRDRNDRDAVLVRARELVKETEDRLARLESELSASRGELRNAEEHARRTEARIAELEAELDGLQDRLSGRDALTFEAETGEPDARSKVDLETAREIHRRTEVESGLEAARSEFRQRTEQARRAEARIPELEAELTTVREELRHRKDLAEQLKVLESGSVEPPDRAPRVEARPQEPETTRGEAATRERMEAELAAARAQLERRTQEAQESETKVAELKVALAAATDGLRQYADAQAELKEAREQLEHRGDAQAELASLRALAERRTREARESEARAAEVEAELEAARAELALRSSKLESLRSEIARWTEQARAAEKTVAALTAELAAAGGIPPPDHRSSRPSEQAEDAVSTILEAADRSVRQIIELARRGGEERLRPPDHGRVPVEPARLTGPREEDPRSARSAIDGARSRIDAVPERIREALQPLTDAIDTLNRRLTDLAGASDMPPRPLRPAEEEAPRARPRREEDDTGDVPRGAHGFGDPPT